MSMTLEKISLLGTPVPLRQQGDNASTQRDGGFAEKLGNALAGDNSSDSGTSGKAKMLAQSISLQMLQNSLSLAGDPSSGQTAGTPLTPFSSANALLKAYRSNLPSEGDSVPQSQESLPSQLQDFDSATDSTPT
ncbi:MAG: hypothetical protein PHI31_14175, partial [Desulfuromonadaceae bacterium]|nr:hypothetical protein [Desulfuromonadaceae bacterium]